MKIQSAGRLGNTLFIWAYAIHISKELKTEVSIFTDKFHTVVGFETHETRKLLSGPGIKFYNSDFLGALLLLTDWVSAQTKKLGNVLKKFLGISDECDPIIDRTQIIRGYFQNSEYVLRNKTYIVEKLMDATYTVEQGSDKLRQLKLKYPKYQVVHIRLGDFANSEFGIVSPDSYKSELEPNIPTLICTDGSREEVLRMIDFSFDEILTPSSLSTWETLSLMQGASKFFGVNSTLSWWGAFLAIARGNSALLPDQWNKTGNSKEFESLYFEGIKKYKALFL
jgi:hypothetical protein